MGLGTGECTEVALTANAKLFTWYGSIISRPKGLVATFVIGVAIMAVLSVGIKDVDYQNQLDKLWIEKGSRAADESDYYDSYFGGPGRIDIIAMTKKEDLGKSDITPSSESDTGMLTKDAIYAFGNMTKSVFGTGAVTYTQNNHTFTWQDVCSRPKFISYLKPWTQLLPGASYRNAYTILSYAQNQASSGGLFYMSRCLADKAKIALDNGNSTTMSIANNTQLQLWFGQTLSAALLDDSAAKTALAATRPGLPFGWGVDRAACTRANILDCWSDGIYDYPEQLQQINDYAFAMLAIIDSGNLLRGVFQALGGSPSTWHDECIAQYTQDLTNTPNIGATLAPTVLSGYTSVSSLMLGAGYWWRPSIEEQSTTATSLADNFIRSASAARTTTATDCVGIGLMQKASYVSIGALQPYVVYNPYAGQHHGCCVNWGSVELTLPLYVGGLVPENLNTSSTNNRFAAALRSSNSAMNSKSKFLKLRFEEELGIADISDDDATSICEGLEQEVIDTLKPAWERKSGSGFASSEKYGAYQAYFLMDRSTQDLFDEAAKVETFLLITGYALLIIYSMVNFLIFERPSRATFVYSRDLVCLAGIITIGASIAASFGFCGWVGIKLSPVNTMLVPFLSMGLGIDDLFVLLHEVMRHHKFQDNVQQRMVWAMADAGSSVTVTSAANVAAFFIPAAVVGIPAVYTFSLQMGIAIILNWISLMFLFAPICVCDSYRASWKTKMCITTEETESSVRERESRFSFKNMAEKFLAPLYANVAFKIVAIIVFLGMTAGLGTLGFLETKKGLKLSDVVDTNHYAHDYLVLQEDFFPLLPGYICTRTIDYQDPKGNTIKFPEFQQNLMAVLWDSSKNKYIDSTNSPASLHFLPAFTEAVTGDVNVPVPTAVFYSSLRSWLSTFGVSYVSDMLCRNQTSNSLVDCLQVDGQTITLEVVQGSVYYNNLDNDDDYVKAIKTIRSDADDSGGNYDLYALDAGNKTTNGTIFDPPKTFYTGSLFKYWQQYVDIENTAYKTVGFALLGVFCVTLVFQASPLTSLLVGLMLLATVLQLYGLMAASGIKLNGWSVTNLSIGVGMAVEFTAHIAYAFLRAHADYEKPDDRVRQALVEIFPPMVCAAITTEVSVAVLAFAKFPFFRLYYFVMISIMLALAFLNGLVFLPVILSVVAPKGLDRAHRARSLSHGGQSKSPDDVLVDSKDNSQL